MNRPLPSFVVFWFLISFPIVIWDALFVLLRPSGSQNWAVFQPYKLYTQVDTRYGDLNDGFVVCQSFVNLLEVGAGAFALVDHFNGLNTSLIWAFATSLSTFVKTLIYFGNEVFSTPAFEFTANATPYDFWMLFVVPSSFWVIFPLICCFLIGKELEQYLNLHASTPKCVVSVEKNTLTIVNNNSTMDDASSSTTTNDDSENTSVVNNNSSMDDASSSTTTTNDNDDSTSNNTPTKKKINRRSKSKQGTMQQTAEEAKQFLGREKLPPRRSGSKLYD